MDDQTLAYPAAEDPDQAQMHDGSITTPPESLLPAGTENTEVLERWCGEYMGLTSADAEQAALRMWHSDIRPEHHRYDDLMKARFHARRRNLELLRISLRRDSPPDEESLQRLQVDQAEDERVTRLALSSDQEVVDNAMHVKEAQIAVCDAEDALQKAKDVATKAEMREIQHTARVREQANLVDCVERMLHKDFPVELLDAVLEAAIRLERLGWRATEPATLDSAVDDFFAWPSALQSDLRTRIRTAAGRALLQKAIIELPADFTNSNSITDLVLPLALMGSEQDIRHLVLEINLTARSPACQAQLNKACRGLGPLSSRLPNLEVFIVSLVLERNQNDDREAPSFDLGKLDLRNYTTFNRDEALKTTLVRLLDILYAKGPGRRKWVRFIDWREDWSSASAGPLVRVPEFVAPQAQDGSSEVDASGREGKVPTGPTIGEQVLEQAYQYHRQFLRR